MRFSVYTRLVLVFNLLVIIWGGFVSASGAGDGCGESWPLCGETAELAVSRTDTLIELSHRLTSGVALISAVVLFIWARRRYEAGTAMRRFAFWALIFMLGEAAIGALIVIFGLVAENESLARAFTQPLHLVNTYLLLAFLGLVAWGAGGWGLGGNLRLRGAIKWVNRGETIRLFAPVLGGLLVISAFGTIASLASTIFPSDTFLEGVRADFSANAHYLVRLRVWHPIFATVLAGYVWWLGRRLMPLNPTLVAIIYGLFAFQYVLGALNAVMLAPIWLSLFHLLISDLLWLSLVWLGAEFGVSERHSMFQKHRMSGVA